MSSEEFRILNFFRHAYSLQRTTKDSTPGLERTIQLPSISQCGQMRFKERSTIRNLVYALAGYNPTAQEVITAFKLYVQEEAKKYEKEFPPELYQEWYRLYQIPPIQGRGRPWEFKSLTVDHIYTPLAKSNGKILELTRALKASDGDRRKKLFQFLSVVGTRALRFQLGRVYQMAAESKTQAEYESKIVKNFGGQLDLPM